MTIQLDDDLIDFFSDIKIKFHWKDIFYIDIMDYFSLLKKGITTTQTCYIIVIYGLINNFISRNDMHNGGSRSDIIIKIYNSYIKSSKFSKSNILEKLLSLFPTNIKSLFEMKYIYDNDELETEMILAVSLLNIIGSSSENNLFMLINTYNPKSINTQHINKINKILQKDLKISSIRLLSNVLNNDTEDMVTALYIDEIDFYIGYRNLYLLAISKKHIKISNMLKDMIIIKNFLVKKF